MRSTKHRAVFFFLFLIMGGNCVAYEGTLLDSITGAPVESVWAVGRWDTGGGFVISGSGCAIAVTRTNAKGKFSLVGRGGGLLSNPFGLRSRPIIYFYKPGYRQRVPSPDNDADPFYLERDDSPALAKFDRLIKMMSEIDCGEESNSTHRNALLPLFAEADEESTAIAKTPIERRARGAIQYYFYLVKYGYREAIARREAERSNEEQ